MWMLFDCSDPSLKTIINLIKKFLELLQLLIPIGLIIFGTIDLGKAVIAGDENDIKKGQKMFIKRCLSAVLVFLVATIVGLVMTFIGNDEWDKCWAINNNISNNAKLLSVRPNR